jgi:hypothetical protein
VRVGTFAIALPDLATLDDLLKSLGAFLAFLAVIAIVGMIVLTRLRSDKGWMLLGIIVATFTFALIARWLQIG